MNNKENQLILTISRSLKIIRNYGLREYIAQVKSKIRNKDFTVTEANVSLNDQNQSLTPETDFKKPTSNFQNEISPITLDATGLPFNLQEKKVLDIGCNEGLNCFECERRGAKVIGIDSSPLYYTTAIKRRNQLSSFVNFMQMYEDDIHELNYSFDLIMFSSFHSIKNKKEVLEKIFEKLDKKGLLVLYLKSGILPDNVDGVKNLLKETGFKNISYFGKARITPNEKPRLIVHATKGLKLSERIIPKTESKKKKIQNYQTFDGEKSGGSNSSVKLEILGIPADLKDKQVLDLGCNEGFFCFECEKRGAKVTGLELSKYWYDAALNRKKESSSSVNFINTSWNEIDKLDNNFDLILFLASFHYVKDAQAELLKKIAAKMNTQGLLILDVGLTGKNEDRFFIEAKMRSKGRVICQYPNKFTIIKLLEDAGFKDISFYKESKIMKDFFPRYVIHAIKP